MTRIVAVAGELHAELRLGATRLRTWRSPQMLVLGEKLPEHLLPAVIGRRLGEVVAHPALVGREYRVIGAINDGRRSGTAVQFTAPSVSWRPPWARLVGPRDDHSWADFARLVLPAPLNRGAGA